MSTVLVTGGSGFVGSHIVAKLLAAGHDVRTTIRSSAREPVVRAMVARAGADAARLSFAIADLERDEGWADAVAGCDYVMHVASPMPGRQPDNEDDLIVPARDGAVRVLRFARDAKVKRVVFTSTCGVIYYGHPPQAAPFDETSWTNIGGGPMSTYVKSKALAERAVWDFMNREGGDLELSVVNPSGIFGPALGPDTSESLAVVKRLLEGALGCPRIYINIVDVRDVADLHLLAMTAPEAKGERFIASSGGVMSMLEMAKVLRARLGGHANKVPRHEIPSFVFRMLAMVKPEMALLVPLLDVVREATSAKAQRVLGWKPRPREDAIVATAESLIDLGIAKV